MNDSANAPSFVDRFRPEAIPYHELKNFLLSSVAMANYGTDSDIHLVGDIWGGGFASQVSKDLIAKYGIDEGSEKFNTLCNNLKRTVEGYAALHIPHDSRIDMRDEIAARRETVGDRLIALGVQDNATRESIIKTIDTAITTTLHSKGLSGTAEQLAV